MPRGGVCVRASVAAGRTRGSHSGADPKQRGPLGCPNRRAGRTAIHLPTKGRQRQPTCARSLYISYTRLAMASDRRRPHRAQKDLRATASPLLRPPETLPRGRCPARNAATRSAATASPVRTEKSLRPHRLPRTRPDTDAVGQRRGVRMASHRNPRRRWRVKFAKTTASIENYGWGLARAASRPRHRTAEGDRSRTA